MYFHMLINQFETVLSKILFLLRMQSNRTKVNKYNQSQDDEFFMSLNQA